MAAVQHDAVRPDAVQQDTVAQETVRRKVIRDCVTLGAAVGASGLSFGAVSVVAGLSTLQACALSLLVFSGGSQFALVGVLGAGGAAAAGIAGASLLGVRNTLYAVRLSTLMRVPRSRRVAAAQLTIDETTAMTITAPEGLRDTAFWVTGVTIFTTWNLATLLGALGAAVFDTNAIGLDAAVGAAFLALLVPQIHDRRGARIAIGGALLAAAAVPVTPAGVPVIVAALAILPAVLRR
jgi:predicted branched-subunit amino acid permease